MLRTLSWPISAAVVAPELVQPLQRLLSASERFSQHGQRQLEQDLKVCRKRCQLLGELARALHWSRFGLPMHRYQSTLIFFGRN
jgi:hypothetical protein